jgi:hypothetical protein
MANYIFLTYKNDPELLTRNVLLIYWLTATILIRWDMEMERPAAWGSWTWERFICQIRLPGCFQGRRRRPKYLKSSRLRSIRKEATAPISTAIAAGVLTLPWMEK